MSDLRARCLTAMTDAMVDEAPALFDEYAAAGLDALLGVLEVEAVEWQDEAWKYPALAEPHRYVTVLKPSTEEAPRMRLYVPCESCQKYDDLPCGREASPAEYREAARSHADLEAAYDAWQHSEGDDDEAVEAAVWAALGADNV